MLHTFPAVNPLGLEAVQDQRRMPWTPSRILLHGCVVLHAMQNLYQITLLTECIEVRYGGIAIRMVELRMSAEL